MNKSSDSPINKENLTNVDWYAIACKIRQQNRELKAKIVELEHLLATQNQKINEQFIELEKKDTLIQKQEQKIVTLDHQLKQQIHEIEFHSEGDEEQQLLIDDLTLQLSQSQQQTAKLERECSLLQDQYNQQQHLLKQKDRESRELQVRLQRQQRYNLQYKAALDQYLQSNNYQGLSIQDNLNQSNTHQGIQPWHQTDNNLNIEQNNPQNGPQKKNNLEDTVVNLETKIPGNLDEDIPELIYDQNQGSTETKIDNLIKEIEQEMGKILQQSSQHQTASKKLDLPIISSTNNQSINSDTDNLNLNSQSVHNENNQQNSKKLLRLPKFGQNNPD